MYTVLLTCVHSVEPISTLATIFLQQGCAAAPLQQETPVTKTRDVRLQKGAVSTKTERLSTRLVHLLSIYGNWGTAFQVLYVQLLWKLIEEDLVRWKQTNYSGEKSNCLSLNLLIDHNTCGMGWSWREKQHEFADKKNKVMQTCRMAVKI